VERDTVEEVGIDEEGRLYLRPSLSSFDYIYRAAMEVNWDKANMRLFGGKPRQWSYLDWFRQIIGAARDEYGVDLGLTRSTIWSNISEELKAEIQAAASWKK